MENGKGMMIKVLKGGKEILVPLADTIKEYSKETTNQVTIETPSILQSILGFIADHPKASLQVLGYGAIVAGIIGLSYSKYYWATPKSFDKKMDIKKQQIIAQLLQNKAIHGAVHKELKSTFKIMTQNTLAGLVAWDNALELVGTTLTRESLSAQHEEQQRRNALMQQSQSFFDDATKETDDILSLQSNFSQDMKSKQLILTEKLGVFTQGLNNLDSCMQHELHSFQQQIQPSAAYNTPLRTQPRKNMFHVIEDSFKSKQSKFDLTELIETLSKYGLLSDDVIADLEEHIDEEKNKLKELEARQT